MHSKVYVCYISESIVHIQESYIVEKFNFIAVAVCVELYVL